MGAAIGAGVGGTVGGAAGFALGGAAGAVAAVPTGEIAGPITIPAGAAEGMAIGAALGMAAGAYVGSAIEEIIGKIEKAFAEDKPEFKVPRSGSGKEKADDVPDWARGNRPRVGESGKKFAERLMREKYGDAEFPKGPGSEFGKIQKWGDRGFKDP